MMMRIKELFLILIFASAACYLQSKVLFNSDVAYHLTLIDQLWHGGKYGKDIFETNPPMILYLYFPVYWLAAIFSTPIWVLAKYYVIDMAIASALLCRFLLEKLKLDQSSIVKPYFYLALLFVFFILPAGEFGQREHLMILLVMPYFLLATLRLQARVNISLAIIIGCLAGLGFSLKPFFLPPLILIELYLILKKRSFFSCLRPELFCVGAVFAMYLLSMAFYQPGYFTIMLPLISHWYFASSASTWMTIFSGWMFYLCVLPVIYFLISRQQKPTQPLLTIFILANIGFICSFLIARNIWFYHTIPAFSLAFINCILLVCEVFPKNHTSNKPIFYRHLFLLIILVFPMLTISISYMSAITERKRHAIDALLAYLDKQATQKNLTCFSGTRTKECYPIILFAHKSSSSRWPFFWWLRAYLKQAGKLTPPQAAEINFMVQTIAADLNRYQYNLVIVNTVDTANMLNNINYINLFEKNRAFKNAWRQYHFQTQIGPYAIYAKN